VFKFFEAIVNSIIFPISFSDCSTFVYRNATLYSISSKWINDLNVKSETEITPEKQGTHRIT
jgi:hypothetical protein